MILMPKDCKEEENTLQLREALFSYNLQFFAEQGAGDKTEKATPKKLEDARKEGRVAKSTDLINGFMLLALFFMLRILGSLLADGFMKSFVKFYNKSSEIALNVFDTKEAVYLGREIIIDIVLVSLPILIGSFIIALIGEIFLIPILTILGASSEVLPYSSDYMRVIFIGTPFVISSMMLNNFIRANGQPKLAMLRMFLGAGTNLILDPLFIYIFNMGMFGAALATIISQIVDQKSVV